MSDIGMHDVCITTQPRDSSYVTCWRISYLSRNSFHNCISFRSCFIWGIARLLLLPVRCFQPHSHPTGAITPRDGEWNERRGLFMVGKWDSVHLLPLNSLVISLKGIILTAGLDLICPVRSFLPLPRKKTRRAWFFLCGFGMINNCEKSWKSDCREKLLSKRKWFLLKNACSCLSLIL